MPKVIESKLRITSDDQATPKLAKIQEELDKVAQSLRGISEISFFDPDKLDRLTKAMEKMARVTERGGQRVRQIRPEGEGEEPAQPASWWGKWSSKMGGQFGFFQRGERGAFTGAVMGAPNMAGRAIGGTMGGGGLETMGGLMQQAGGSSMAAFGGFGAIAGAPLLAAGALMFLAKKLSEPAQQYGEQFADLAATIGMPAITQGRAAGLAKGFGPAESARLTGQLAQFGAQKGVGMVGALRYGGMLPTESIKMMETMARVGGVTKDTDFRKLGRELAAAIADKTKIQSMPSLMESMIGAQEIASHYLGDMTVTQRESAIAMGKWLAEAPTAALRGSLGTQNVGNIMGWVSGTKNPAAQMLIMQSIAGLGPAERKKLGAPETGPLGYYGMQDIRNNPDVWPYILKSMSSKFNMNEMTEIIQSEMGIPRAQAKSIAGYFGGGGGRNAMEEKNFIDATIKKGSDEPKKIQNDLEKVREHTAEIQDKQLTAAFDLIDSVTKTELEMVKQMSEALKNETFSKSTKLFFDGVTEFVKLLGGDKSRKQLSEKSTEGIISERTLEIIPQYRMYKGVKDLYDWWTSGKKTDTRSIDKRDKK